MRNRYMIIGLLIILIAFGFVVVNQEVFNPQKKAKILITKGKFYMEQSDKAALRKAVDEFTTAASLYPESSYGKEALYYLANTYEKMGMLDIAAGKYKELEQAKINENLKKRVRFKIAKLQILRSYTDEGVSGLMVLLANTRDKSMRSEIYTELGNYYRRLKRYNKAQRNYEIALSEDSLNREARIKLAEILGLLGKHKAAYSVYENYLSYLGDLDPLKPEVVARYRGEVVERGKNLFRKGKVAQALDFFGLVRRRFPRTNEAEEAAYYEGIAYFNGGNYKKATEMFNRVISNDPNTQDEPAYVKKGESLYQMKEYKRAAAVFSEYRRIFPRGRFYQIANDWEQESIRAFREKEGLLNDTTTTTTTTVKEKNEPIIIQKEQKIETEEIEEPQLNEEDNISP